MLTKYKRPTPLDCSHIQNLVSSLTIYEAVMVLQTVDTFAYESKTLYVRGQAKYFVDLIEDCNRLHQSLNWLPNMYFTGGPPGNEEWIYGTATQYVADCLLVDLVMGKRDEVFQQLECVIKSGTP